VGDGGRHRYSSVRSSTPSSGRTTTGNTLRKCRQDSGGTLGTLNALRRTTAASKGTLIRQRALGPVRCSSAQYGAAQEQTHSSLESMKLELQMLQRELLKKTADQDKVLSVASPYPACSGCPGSKIRF